MKLLMESWRKYIAEAKNEDGKEQGADGKACWKGYKHAGTEDGKDKCVKMEEETRDTYDDEVEKENEESRKRGAKELGLTEEEQVSEETDKDKMKCNSPRYIKDGEPGHGKKQKVVKACSDGEEKIVRFGDANLEDRSDNPDAKANFRARHNCDDKKDKMKAGYWSCKEW